MKDDTDVVEPRHSMRQVAPDPEALRQLVNGLGYKPGWRFRLSHIDRGQGEDVRTSFRGDLNP